MKVLYFTNLTVPYRKDFFSELGKYCDLTVWVETCQRRTSNSEWLKRGETANYRMKILPEISFGRKIRMNYGYKKDFLQEKFDLVVVGTYYSLSAQLFILFLSNHHIRFLLNSDGGFIKNDSVLKKAIKSYYISRASAYLSTGKVTTDYLYYYGGKKKNYTYPFTSVWGKDLVKHALSKDERQMQKWKLGINYESMIISVGSCIYRKGYDVLLNAVRYFDPSVGVFLIGGKETDDQLNSLKKYVVDNHLNQVHFIPFLGKEALRDYYLAADVFVLPTREDIWGLVINEAMACGLPVVTTNRCIAGLEMVQDGVNGFLVKTDDTNMLHDAIEKIIHSEALQAQMSKESLEVAQNYTIEQMAKDHIKAFENFASLGE